MKLLSGHQSITQIRFEDFGFFCSVRKSANRIEPNREPNRKPKQKTEPLRTLTRKFWVVLARFTRASKNEVSNFHPMAVGRPTRIHKRGFRCIRKPSYVMLHIRADSKCHCWSILGGKVFRKAFHNPTESKTYEILSIRRPANYKT